ncbi:MAG: 23S rRNA (adenine(2503)-C(2))-methyltransferase RlmN [Planctomycetes bacterium]|nr:23S rRNA (adenine(2503)-C(2))-methyltransferase RlmN [Planctomycetota bacterium]
MRADLAGLTFTEFSTWARGVVGHSDRFHLPLYRQVVLEGRFAPGDSETWREAEAGSPGVVARLTAAAAERQRPEVVDARSSEDPLHGRTTKLVMRLADGLTVESVLIPMGGSSRQAATHYTLCVSSQVGCKMGCSFCHTARMGLVRQLAAHEIVGQITAAAAHTGVRVRNVVFMGMGEPMDNLEAVAQAVRVFTDTAGCKLAHRHVTISTVGRADGIARLAALGLDRVNLAVSLTAADDALRSRLMPVNRVTDLATLKAALLAHPLPADRRILVSYVLLGGVTDGAADADRLIAWLTGMRALVNLIPFNEFPGSGFQRPDDATILAFRERLDAAGVHVRLRLTKGDGVMAACGQLGDLALRRVTPRAGLAS